MTIPRATYRLQFRNGMDFDRAAGIVPYLARLGVSHLYASPIFTAATGSTHGYDVTDHNAFDPALGGEEGFERLSHALKKAGLGLILDIVPNHMAASLENRWWHDLLEWGIESPYHNHFDVEWAGKLTLPILGRPYPDALAAGEFRLTADAEQGRLTLRYFDHQLPLQPATYGVVLHGIDDPAARGIEAIASGAKPDGDSTSAIRDLLSDAEAHARLQRQFDLLSRHPALIDSVHSGQAWRLIFWKEARRHLTYRRFFEVTGLVGVRIELDSVFDDVHRLALRLMREGKVDGLRIDHVDGLADPTAYLARLRREIGPDRYLVVEKILGATERLPEEWPIQGTTGYEFIADLAHLLTDAAKAPALDAAYAALAGGPADLAAEIRSAKRAMLLHNFEVEYRTICRLAAASAVYMDNRRSSLDDIDDAIAELILGLPVYRTYGRLEGDLPGRDAELMKRIAEDVRAGGRAAPHALDLVLKLLHLDVSAPALPAARVFRRRFQQLSGPIMAKAVEDTLFYRFNRAIALNEVGGEPMAEEGGAERFHARMAERLETQPAGLLATATHDTKRGEDARARLYAISEAPDEWAAAVSRWRAMHAGAVAALPDGPAPEPETEWLIYQALAGIWPDSRQPIAPDVLDEMTGRFLSYVEKALREAKKRTDWTEVNAAYEEAVKDYAFGLLAPANAAFHEDFASALQPFIRAGHFNSLAQTLVKMSAPGVPDIYQGSEAADFSLVDPDNRRPIAFDRLGRLLGAADVVPFGEDDLASGRSKQALIAACLSARRRHEALFSQGAYLGLAVSGTRSNHLLAFARIHEGRTATCVVPRLLFAWCRDRGDVPDAGFWADTLLHLPPGQGRLLNVLTGEEHAAGGRVPAGEILGSAPVALLVPV